MNKTWRYNATSKAEYIPSLHDAVATKIELTGGDLILSFPDGFKLLPGDPNNPYDEAHQTKVAQLVFSKLQFLPPEYAPEESVLLEVFHDHYLHPIRLFRSKRLFTTCRYPSVAELTKNVNRGKWTLEFVFQLSCFDTASMFECYLHTKRSIRRCYLTVNCKQLCFRWNEVAESPAW